MDQEAILTTITLIVGLAGIFWQINAKRQDDIYLAHLSRIDRQISELYGPLYALFESGDRQWRAFLDEFSTHRNSEKYLGFFPGEDDDNNDFPMPSKDHLRIYRLWNESVFFPINIKMEDIMINNAELIVGDTIPDAFLQFSTHMAGMKAKVAEWQKDYFDSENWKLHVFPFAHPERSLDFYVTAAFSVIKRKQSELLSGKINKINESEIASEISKEERRLHENYNIINQRDYGVGHDK